METALSLINELPSTYAQMSKFVHKVRDEVLSGEYNPLEVLIQLRAAKEALEILNKDEEILQAASKEFSKYGEKTVDLKGVKVTSQESGVRYDFSVCGDKKWSQFKNLEEAASANRKDREAFLKTVKDKFILVNEETGEAETIHPVAKTSKTTLAVTLK